VLLGASDKQNCVQFEREFYCVFFANAVKYF
jgi:hypothetical protein